MACIGKQKPRFYWSLRAANDLILALRTAYCKTTVQEFYIRFQSHEADKIQVYDPVSYFLHVLGKLTLHTEVFVLVRYCSIEHSNNVNCVVCIRKDKLFPFCIFWIQCTKSWFTNFQAPPQAAYFLWSCDKVYHKQEVCFLLYFLGQIVSWQYNPNLLN